VCTDHVYVKTWNEKKKQKLPLSVYNTSSSNLFAQFYLSSGNTISTEKMKNKNKKGIKAIVERKKEEKERKRKEIKVNNILSLAINHLRISTRTQSKATSRLRRVVPPIVFQS